jgi:hypothetical protein
LAQEKPQKLGLVRLLKPKQYADTARIARMESAALDNPSLTAIAFSIFDF